MKFFSRISFCQFIVFVVNSAPVDNNMMNESQVIEIISHFITNRQVKTCRVLNNKYTWNAQDMRIIT